MGNAAETQAATRANVIREFKFRFWVLIGALIYVYVYGYVYAYLLTDSLTGSLTYSTPDLRTLLTNEREKALWAF